MHSKNKKTKLILRVVENLECRTLMSSAPTATLAPVATPTATPVSSETVIFSEAVTGLSPADFSLSRSLGANIIGPFQTLTQVNSVTYSIGNLTPLTAISGSYVLTLSPDAITGADGALAGGATISWQMTANVPEAPAVQLAAIATPTLSPVATEAITFNEPVTNFTASNLSLTLNGGSNLLDSTETLTSTDQTNFTLSNLTAATTAVGTYKLTISPTGINGDGISLASGTSVSWTVVAPTTITLAPITSPTTSPISSETITFSKAVTGFTVADLSLTENGGANLLTRSQTLTTTNNITYTLTNLAPVTDEAGVYTLTVTPTGVMSSGVIVPNGATVSWQANINPTATLAAIASPQLAGVPSETITFNEPVTGLALSDLSLTLNGGANLLTSSQMLTTTDNTTFTLGNLAPLTAAAGKYVLTLGTTGITDSVLSLPMLNGTSVTWSLDLAPTAYFTNVISPRATPVSSEVLTFDQAVTGMKLADLSLTRGTSTTNLLTSANTLTTTNNVTFTLNNLNSITSIAGNYTLTLKPSGIVGSNGLTMVSGNSVSWTTTTTTATAAVVGRDLFYNDSYYDGYSTAATTADSRAIATDKTALLPGQTASYANISNYYHGINGVMIDISGLPSTTLTATDFIFKTGNVNTTSTWKTGPAPVQIAVFPGAGVGGSSRVELIWPLHSGLASSAVAKGWLQITVKPDVNTGLGAADVFYFGNAIGDTGQSKTSAAVTAGDVTAIRAHFAASPVAITDVYDITKNGGVDSVDATQASDNKTAGSSVFDLITPQ